MAVTLGTIDMELILRPKGTDRETVLGVVSIPLSYGQPDCGARVGPTPKLDGETFSCSRAAGHGGDHEAADGTWWVDAVARR